ncbi:hypothetical protein HNY73_006229 [Argiope bruennichi]|uniref:Transcriptional coactivator p15 (PC4) C-terminal domain-containing protein n=1 Tax=Argiope bruennichi TaxID=94029 RepID=A0A8T0FLT2_ARGBR|nr:hypothetical protein HNY73_006229 [Argiope bruennichi]
MFLSKAGESSKRKCEQYDRKPKKLCFDQRIEGEITMDTLPKHTVHLGDGLFTLVNAFHKKTRVHIRVYSADGNGILHPTKEGISLKPEIWSSILCTLSSFPAREDRDAVSVVKKEVCILNHTVYILKAFNNNVIEDTFYEREMQKVKDSGHYPVEKVIKKRSKIEKLNIL